MSVNSNCGKTEMRDEYEWVSLTKFGSLFCNRLQHVTSFFPHFSTGEAGRKDQHKPTLLSTCYSYSPFTLDKERPTCITVSRDHTFQSGVSQNSQLIWNKICMSCEQAQELTAIKHWGLSTRLRERNPLRRILTTAAASVRRGSAAFPHSPEMFRHILQNTALCHYFVAFFGYGCICLCFLSLLECLLIYFLKSNIFI